MKQILVVDDEVNCIRIIENLIDKFHVPMEICASASTGTLAINLVLKHKPELVFMDIEMPGLNGLETIKLIQSQIDYNIKFVIISAYDNFKYAQEALRLGVNDFLLKPIDSHEFIDMIQKFTGFQMTKNIIFNQILSYVHAHMKEPLELKQISEQFHITPNHITKLFKKYLNLGFTEYKNKIRIDYAIRLFKETEFSIKEVCFEVGYANMNYFYKLFKESTGETPKSFKELMCQYKSPVGLKM